jgi:hypothetical protein
VGQRSAKELRYMNSSFFPEPGPIPEPEHHVVPAWLQPPEDEYPVRVLVREFLARTNGTSLAISHVDVYSTGVKIKVDWELRRLDESVVEWQLATGMGHFYGGTGASDSGLRFGLALGDGTVVTTVDRFGHPNFLEQPVGWSLMDRAGGGGGGEMRYSGTSGLWLWPLPPPGRIELVAEWRAREIAETRIVLDASTLLSAVAGIRSIWP